LCNQIADPISILNHFNTSGIKLRAVKGLKGCKYLDPGAITDSLSYVMGPVAEMLEVRLNPIPFSTMNVCNTFESGSRLCGWRKFKRSTSKIQARFQVP
jgi:hypothetical protein